MSVERFKADLEAANRKQAARQKLAEILEFWLGKFRNNPSIINSIDAAGLLDTATVVDFSIFNELCLSKEGQKFVAQVLRQHGIAVKGL